MEDLQNTSKLPDELLSIIIDFLYPGDIVSFASTCHRFYRLSTERLLQHHTNHATYRRTVISSRILDFLPTTVKQFDNPLELLVELDEDPSLFYYMRLLEIDEILDDYVDEYITYTRSKFPDLVKLSPLLQCNATYKEQCVSRISKGNVDDCLMLILSLATELTHFRTWGPTFSKCLQDKASSQAVPYCQNLRWIEVFSIDDQRRDVSWFIHWARLPQLETLSIIENRLAVQAWEIYDWPPSQRMKLSNLHLFSSHSNGQGVALILAGLTSLKSFTYTNGIFKNTSWEWQTRIAMEALGIAALDTLESLVLHMSCPPDDLLVSLKAFKRLRRFCGSFGMLPRSSSHDSHGKLIETLDLEAVFPASLTHLELTTSTAKEQPDFNPFSVSFTKIEGCPKLEYVALTECDVSPDVLRVFSERSLSVKMDWTPQLAGDSVYEGALPEEWWHDCLYEPDDIYPM